VAGGLRLRRTANGAYVAVDSTAPDWFIEAVESHDAELRALLAAGFMAQVN
jgi:hypothetical protein